MFDEISGIRWAGMIAGIAIVLLASRQLRTSREGKAPALMSLTLGIAVFLVSVFTSLGRIPAELLSLTRMQGGVLITLLLIAVAFVYVITLWNRYKLDYVRRRLNDTIHGLALNPFVAAEAAREPDPPERIWVVIPAYNEADNIPHVMASMPQTVGGYPVTVLVIDDGSSDATGEAAGEAGALVLRMPANVGQGSALRAGYDAALKRRAVAVVTLDADGQNVPEEMEGVVRPVIDGTADAVIGSRILGKHEHTSLARSVGVHVFNLILRLITGRRFTDCASSFRAFSPAVLREVVLDQEQYQSTEILIEAAKRGYRIAERPITFRRRKYGTTKKGGNLLYGALFFRAILKTWLR